MSGWIIDEATAAQREELLRIEATLFSPESALRAQWLFDRNPAGKALVLVAVTDGGAIAGTRALLPWKLLVDGRETLVGQYARTWTHPDHRNLGISVALGEALNRRSAELGYPVVILFPSVRSIPGHRHIGNRVDEMLERRQVLVSPRFFLDHAPQFLDVPLRWIRRFRRRRGSWRPVGDAAAVAERLMGGTRRTGVCGLRDGAFVRWRYSAESGRKYESWSYPDAGAERLLAFTHIAGNRARIIDLCGDLDEVERGAALAGLVELLAERGAALVEWCPPRYGGGPGVARRGGMTARRHGVPLARWFNRTEDELGALADIEQYRLTEGDSDYA